jgi:hypothetical protein
VAKRYTKLLLKQALLLSFAASCLAARRTFMVTADWKSNWNAARPADCDQGTRKKIATHGLGRLMTYLPGLFSLARCQEIVNDSIRDIASETATCGQVKPEMLSGKNSAQGCFFSRC